MEFKYTMTVWECIACGCRNVLHRLLFKSKTLRTVILILGGTAVLVNVIHMAESGRIGIVGMMLVAVPLLLLLLFVLLIRSLDAVVRLYRQNGKQQKTVWIEDGSIYVTERRTTREYLCRNILELGKWGCVYRIVVTGRLGRQAEIYLPTRVIGGREKQEEFRRYVNSHRKLSGHKLTVQAQDAGAAAAEHAQQTIALQPVKDSGCILQVWNLEKLTEAVVECNWIIFHHMRSRIWKDWLEQGGVQLLLCCLLIMVSMHLAGFGWLSAFGVIAAIVGVIAVRVFRQMSDFSCRSSRRVLEGYGREIYEESWELYFTPQGIERKIPMTEAGWDWTEIGYLMETDRFFHFFSKEQRVMFYMEKELLGEWKEQKLFIQDCQAKGVQYQVVHPAILRDVPPQPQNAPVPAEPPVLHVVQGGKACRGRKDYKERKECKGRQGRRRNRKNVADTQEGWRRFWAEKEKERRAENGERLRVVMTVLAVVGIFLLAIFLPEFNRTTDLGGYPVLLDAPAAGEEYVFHPEVYPGYKPLAEQVEVLEGLGFVIPQTAVDEMFRSMKEFPESRVWVEGYPYQSLLSWVGMPQWDYDAWEITSYPEQAYWFDWEGFDMSTEYTNILNGVSTMAGGDFTITDAKQDMSDADWEKGTGSIRLRFSVNGKPYEYRLKLMNDWLDTRIVKDINDALKDAGVEKRVYAMEDGGQGCILFCRDEAWAKQFTKATGIRLETK